MAGRCQSTVCVRVCACVRVCVCVCVGGREAPQSSGSLINPRSPCYWICSCSEERNVMYAWFNANINVSIYCVKMITNRCEQDTNTQLLVLSEETDGLMYACRTAAITEGPNCMPSPFCLIKGVLLCPAKACRLCICTLSLRTLCVRMCYPARSISVRVTTSAVKESKRGGKKS